jgi:transposase InsO family protein
VELARYIVDAVVLEGRSYGQVARAHGVSKSWVAKCVWRFKAGGYEAITPRSKAALRIPHRTSSEFEDEIVRLRKLLSEDGFDAGAQTIQHHLQLIHDEVPAVSTIHRVLSRRGFVTPQPQKRPRSSWIRFEADLPNQCWQSDVTHWTLAGGSGCEIVNFIDDYSRAVVASKVFSVVTAPAVLGTFHEAAKAWGFPASVLTDNGAVYTAAYRGGRSAMESELLRLGVEFKHSRPYHPQTCGKVERFHHTLKAFLAKQDPAETIEVLQAQIDRFTAYYNNVRPHRARGRITPRSAFDARDKASPSGLKLSVSNETRVRRDRVDRRGAVSIRYRSKLYHVGIGRDFAARRVIVLVNGLEIRVLTEDGEVLRHLELDPTKNYQGTGKPPGPPKGRLLGPRKPKPSTMP